MFALTITSTQVVGGTVARTPTSGASVDPAASTCDVTVQASDDPYGVMEFTPTRPAAPLGYIPAAVAAPRIETHESAGNLTIYIIRAQGTVGTAYVDYATGDGTAVGSGATPDYKAISGNLTFLPGEDVKTVTLELLDDDIPEVPKWFVMTLSGVSGSKYF